MRSTTTRAIATGIGWLCLMVLGVLSVSYVQECRRSTPLQNELPTVEQEIRRAPTESEHTPLRWWEDDSRLCVIANLMVHSDNLRKLHSVLEAQVKAVDVGCAAPAVYDSNGINQKCLDATLKARVAIDRFLKKMVKDHGGPLIDRNWNNEE